MVAILLGADNGFFYAGQVMHFSSPFTVFLIYHKHLNKTDQPFITSDNPVCVINCGDSVGLCSLGCIVAIPICPDILIMMVDNRFPVQDRKVVEMCDIKIVDYLNKQQHNNCSRCLFSISDDFSFVHSE